MISFRFFRLLERFQSKISKSSKLKRIKHSIWNRLCISLLLLLMKLSWKTMTRRHIRVAIFIHCSAKRTWVIFENCENCLANAFHLQIAESDIFLIEQLIEVLFESKEDKAPEGVGLKSMANFLKVAYTSSASHLKDRIDSFYRVFLENEPTTATQKDDAEDADDDDQKLKGTRKIVNFWCFSPAFG